MFARPVSEFVVDFSIEVFLFSHLPPMREAPVGVSQTSSDPSPRPPRVEPGPPLSFQRIIVIPLDKPWCFGGQTMSNMFK